MTQLTSLARIGLFAGLAITLASACGGQSFSGGNGDGDAGSSSQAGRAQGGSSSHAGTGSAGKAPTAGTSSSAGTGSAGRGQGGHTSAGTGSGGASGGSAPYDEACDAPPASGSCNAYFPAWYHDPATGVCRPFSYGGCQGNANRYGSLAECQKACPGGTPDYDACKQPSDCVVTGTGCCGICDSPDITAHDLIAYNRMFAGIFQCGIALDVAQGGGSAAGATAPAPACAPCPGPQPGGTLKFFVPNCVQGQCMVEDLRTSAVTACTQSEDCKVRSGYGCCQGCGAGGNLVGVRKDGSFEELVCGGETTCPACVPSIDSNARAVCTGGHCQVAIAVDSL